MSQLSWGRFVCIRRVSLIRCAFEMETMLAPRGRERSVCPLSSWYHLVGIQQLRLDTPKLQPPDSVLISRTPYTSWSAYKWQDCVPCTNHQPHYVSLQVRYFVPVAFNLPRRFLPIRHALLFPFFLLFPLRFLDHWPVAPSTYITQPKGPRLSWQAHNFLHPSGEAYFPIDAQRRYHRQV